MVAEAEPMLQACWGRALQPLSDILVLGDLRCKDNLENVATWWERREINRVLRESEEKATPPMMPFLQPRGFLLALESSGDPSFQLAAKELRGIRNGLGLVPLLVITSTWTVPMSWTPPGLAPVVLRHSPDAGPEAN
jgi:hypothetical protein